MPIDFNCPECNRHYRVKDELAGKGAKCGKCGHRMQIPAGQSVPAPSKTSSPPKPRAPVAAKAPHAVAAPRAASADSWLDEELEKPQPAVPIATKPAGASCPSCGAALASKAVLCVSCGYDLRTRAKLETRHVIETEGKASPAPKKKRGKLAGAASLLRGTVFSFLAAMFGAVIWAGLAYLTNYEFGFVAWGLGGLAGLGMALGHDDDDGTFAGIIAAFMSLIGIIAAKVFIIVIVIGAAVAAAVGELEIDENSDPVEAQREFTALAIAAEELEQDGTDFVSATDEQRDQAMATARQEVASMNEEELTKRMEQFDAEDDAATEAPDELAAQVPGVENAPAQLAEDESPGMVGGFFSLMFSPIDGLFILMAFFTAYAVGSGQMSD